MQHEEILADFFKPQISENNYTEVCVDGPDCLAMLLGEIEKAKHYIHFQMMLFYSDEAGQKVASALAEKAKEGVEVRVMSDSDMSNFSRAVEVARSSGTSHFTKLSQMFSHSGVQFTASVKESYKEIEWYEIRKKLVEKGVPDEFIFMQDAIQDDIQINANVVDHRKLIVIDGETAIVTSMNVANRYLYESTSDDTKQWHDGCLLIQGPCASILNRHFASKWMIRGGDVFDYKKHHRDNKTYGTDTCTVYSCYPGMKTNHIRNYFINKIKDCKGKFIIENSYINDELFYKELAALPREQAEKIIIINPYNAKGNDYPQNHSSIRCNMWKPFKNGVTFYDYSKRMAHWKTALDVEADEVFHGSYNLNYRSALHDFELNVSVKSKQLAQKVKQLLEADIQASARIEDAGEFYKYPLLHFSCYSQEVTDFFE